MAAVASKLMNEAPAPATPVASSTRAITSSRAETPQVPSADGAAILLPLGAGAGSGAKS